MFRRLGLRRHAGAPLTCPYCHASAAALEALWACPRCKTVHHKACAAENGRCTILGCEAPFVAAPAKPGTGVVWWRKGSPFERWTTEFPRILLTLGVLLLIPLTPLVVSKLPRPNLARPPAATAPRVEEQRDFSPEIAGALLGEAHSRTWYRELRDSHVPLRPRGPSQDMATARTLVEATSESDRPALEARVRQLVAAELAHSAVSPPAAKDLEGVLAEAFAPTPR
jgi:hypothetical protein